jgi:hypothetical protein
MPCARAALKSESYWLKAYLIVPGFFFDLGELTTLVHATFTRRRVAWSLSASLKAFSRL